MTDLDSSLSPHRARVSLSLKVIGVLVVMLVLIVPPAAYWNIQTQQASLEEAYVKKARTLGQLLDATISERADLDDEAALFTQLQRFLWLNPDLLRIDVAVVTADGLRMRISTEAERTAEMADPMYQAALDRDQVITVVSKDEQMRVARVASPIHLSRAVAGVIGADLSLEPLEAALQTQMRTHITGALLLAFVLGLSLFIALRYVVLRPLAMVGSAVDAIARRDTEHGLSLESRDEFGQLSRSFNAMATALREAELQAEHLAFHDALTGLPNRRMLIDRLHLAVAASNRYGRRGALLYLDLDGFKAINDSMGHAVGDTVLAEVASRLLQAVRQVDTVARIGGDEFVILLQELPDDSPADQERVNAVADKVLQAFESPVAVGAGEHRLGVSLGVRIFDQDDLSADAILQDADEAMYLAKRAGGQQLRFFAYDEVKAARRRHVIRRTLAEAIHNGEIQAHFQPQVDASGTIHGVESLLRWAMPEWGFAPPRDVVQAAEELGLMDELGELMLRHSADAYHQCAAAGFKLDHVVVNLSPTQFKTRTFADNLMALRNELGLPWGGLVVEITERAILDDLQGMSALMSTLRAHGIKFIIDDFGTGFSSIEYLKHLPVDGIKIDRSFVRDMGTSERNNGLVTSMFGMARDLNLTTVSEGVETRGQLEALRELGCNCFQGYYFSEALEVSRLLRLLEDPQSEHWFAERRRTASHGV